MTFFIPPPGFVSSVPREAWLAGPASRAPYLGRLAGPIEAILGRARGAIRGSPGILRRIGRIPGPGGGILAPLLFLEAVEWAAEWLRDEAVPALREWARPTSPPDPSPGGRRYGWFCEYEYWDYGPLGFPEGAPELRSERYERRPDQFFPRVVQILAPPEYYEESRAAGLFWGLRVKVTSEADPPGSTSFYPAARAMYRKSRYRFKRILDFGIFGDPSVGPTAPEIFDPELVDPLAPSPPVLAPIPFALPLPGISPIPGDLRIWAPPARVPSPAFPGEPFRHPGIDLDWIPRREERPDLMRFPGLRIGFRPWGVVVVEVEPQINLDFRFDSLIGLSDCPDPCPDLDYDRIQRIVEAYSNRLGDARQVPDLAPGTWSEFQEEILLELDEDVRAIQYEFDTAQYLGGTIASELGPPQGFCGLYSFDFGSKLGLDFYEGKIPRPHGSDTFWAQTRKGARLRVRLLRLPPITFPIE